MLKGLNPDVLGLFAAIGAVLCIGGFLLAWWQGAFTSDTDPASLVGQEGVALETFSSSGSIMVQGEEWKATSSRGIIEKGHVVRVIKHESGLVLLVETIDNKGSK